MSRSLRLMPLLSKSAGAAFCDAGERHIAYCQGLQLGKQRRVAPLHDVPAADAKMRTHHAQNTTKPFINTAHRFVHHTGRPRHGGRAV